MKRSGDMHNADSRAMRRSVKRLPPVSSRNSEQLTIFSIGKDSFFNASGTIGCFLRYSHVNLTKRRHLAICLVATEPFEWGSRWQLGVVCAAM